MVGAADHPPLGRVDGGLGMVLHPALVAAVLGRVHGDQPRPAKLRGHLLGRPGHEPVVRVHEVEGASGHTAPGPREHVVVHIGHPAQERVDVAGEVGLAHAVDVDAMALLLGGKMAAAAGEHVHLDPAREQVLGELSDVASEPALDHGRVFPGEQEDAHGGAAHPTGAPQSAELAPRSGQVKQRRRAPT